jgi:CheY-like chemotaxis protein
LKNHVPSILALEPDVRQASILKRILRDRVHADLIVVDSRDAAVAAVNAHVPDVILLTALLSPRDEAEIIEHLRTIDGAEHVQTHTIPQLASSSEDGDSPAPQGGLLGKLRRKKVAEPIPGCDPYAFAEEVGTFIARAAEMKVITAAAPSAPSGRSAKRAAKEAKRAGAAAATSAEPAEESSTEENSESAWSSPFEWRRSDSSGGRSEKRATPPATREPLVTSAPLAVVAEEEEQRRAQENARAREEAEREQARLEAEEAARRERERVEAEAAAQRERERLEAEAAARREQ